MSLSPQLAKLAAMYRDAATVAFGWAETRRIEAPFVRDKVYSKDEAEAWLDKYIGGCDHSTAQRIANQPGSPLHLIGLAFCNMQQSAEEWDVWGCRLLAAHDHLVRE